jgi:hypothetical protein
MISVKPLRPALFFLFGQSRLPEESCFRTLENHYY